MTRAKTIELNLLALICAFVALAYSNQALAGTPSAASETPLAPSIGSSCREDPSCVIVGGTHMLEWKSPAPAKILVVCIHGLGLCAGAYKKLAQELSGAGIDGYGVNVRGFGPDREQPDRAKLDCVETVKDVRKLLAGLHETHPDYKVFLVGESMGGALAIRIAAENPELIDGVVCSAPAWKLLKIRRTAVKGIVELVLFSDEHPGPASRSIMHQATTDKELTAHWLSDPSHRLKLSFGEATSFLRFISRTDEYIGRLDKPVLFVQGLNDRLVSPYAVAKLFKHISADNKTFLIDCQAEHLVLEEGNFSKALSDRLINWMKVDYQAQSGGASVEVVNGEMLSRAQRRQLSKLWRTSESACAVKWAGALRKVHLDADFSGRIDLSPLAALPHLYAVGPLEDLQGEVTIWDSKPLISKVKNEKVQVDHDLTGKACFLVYGQVRSWKKAIHLGAGALKMSDV